MKTWLIVNNADDTVYGVSQLTGAEAPVVGIGKSAFEVDASLYGLVFRDPMLIYKRDKASAMMITVVNPQLRSQPDGNPIWRS